MADPINNPDAVAQQDQLRTLRAFVGFAGQLLGDQQLAGADGYAMNQPYQYQSIGPTGWGIEGAPISSAQGAKSAAGVSPVVLVLGAVVAMLVLPKLLK